MENEKLARFPPDVYKTLSTSGWYPGRNVASAVDEWLRRTRIADALDFHGAAQQALVEFGGLHVPQQGPGGNPGGGFTSHFYPAAKAPSIQKMTEFGELLKSSVFPLGWNDDGPSDLVIDKAGRVFQLHWADDFFIGENLDAALVWMVRGGPLSVVNEQAEFRQRQ